MLQKLKDQSIQYLKNTYDCIKQRCYNANNPAYKNYGERGINIASEWKNNRKKFTEDILSTIGHRTSKIHQLDRIDVNRNYEPGNLRWSTPEENNKNKRNNNLIKIGKETRTLTEWAKKSRISQSTILWRVKNNWTENKWLEPIKKNKKVFDELNLRAIYDNIKDRCYNPKSSIYKNYGGRGINMHQEWICDYKKFKKDIVNSIGARPSLNNQLDRINNNGNYELTNLKWSTPKENCRNKRNNNNISINGEIKTLVEWSEISGVKRSTIKKRLQLGYSEKDLLLPNLQKRFGKQQIQNIKKLNKQQLQRGKRYLGVELQQM